MGYYVRYLKNKKSEPRWRLEYVSKKKEHTKHLEAKFPQKAWIIGKSRWHELGFRMDMSLDEARVRQKQLNIQLRLSALLLA